MNLRRTIQELVQIMREEDLAEIDEIYGTIARVGMYGYVTLISFPLFRVPARQPSIRSYPPK